MAEVEERAQSTSKIHDGCPRRDRPPTALALLDLRRPSRGWRSVCESCGAFAPSLRALRHLLNLPPDVQPRPALNARRPPRFICSSPP